MSRLTIDLTGRSKEELLAIATSACATLCQIANYAQTDEGDEDDTEEEFGLSAKEIVCMAHDDMIQAARATLQKMNDLLRLKRARS